MERFTEQPEGMTQPRLKAGHGFRWRYADSKAQEAINRFFSYENIELTPFEIEQQLSNFSAFLCEMTDGKMSKTNYTVETMISVANDCWQSVCDECGDIQELKAYRSTSLSPADIADLKNEQCLLCGKYKTAHEGSCDGCRWKKG